MASDDAFPADFMPLPSAARKPTPPRHSYFVVAIDYGRKGREAVVDPEITRANVIDRIRSREYSPIAFIHEIAVDENGCGTSTDVTNELLAEAGFYEREAAE